MQFALSDRGEARFAQLPPRGSGDIIRILTRAPAEFWLSSGDAIRENPGGSSFFRREKMNCYPPIPFSVLVDSKNAWSGFPNPLVPSLTHPGALGRPPHTINALKSLEKVSGTAVAILA